MLLGTESIRRVPKKEFIF
jgi:hypothetical protein